MSKFKKLLCKLFGLYTQEDVNRAYDRGEINGQKIYKEQLRKKELEIIEIVDSYQTFLEYHKSMVRKVKSLDISFKTFEVSIKDMIERQETYSAEFVMLIVESLHNFIPYIFEGKDKN